MPASGPSVDESVSFDLDTDQSNAWDADTWRGGFVGDGTMSPEDIKLQASLALADILIDKYNSGKRWATDVCKIAYWAREGGMRGATAELVL